MIISKIQLKSILKEERKLYKKNNLKQNIIDYITREPSNLIWKYQKFLRKTEYYYNSKNLLFNKLMYLYYRFRKNKLGVKLGIEMWENSFESGLLIFHAGNIVVNGKAKVGKNCKFHGDNCIGNDGFDESNVPILGNNIRIGVGAKIIGDVQLADNIVVAAGAIVVDSFKEEGITVAGIPARKVK